MNRSVALLLTFVFIISSCIITTLPANADSRTIIVPDDYPTITAAIGNSTCGDTILVKKGMYQEKPLKIDKTLTLIGEGADSTKISFDPPYTEEVVNVFERHRFYEDPIKVNANDFKMSDFTVETTGGSMIVSGNGTKLTGNQILTELQVLGSNLNITGNRLPYATTISGNDSKISANIGYSMWIFGSFDDISLNIISGSVASAGLRFEGNFSLIYDNSIFKAPYGRFSVAGNNNTVFRNIVDDLAIGLAISGSNNTVCSNRITNSGVGLEDPRRGNMVYANYVAGNGWGINTGYDSLTATLYHNNFISNTYQVSTFSNYPTQYFDNGAEGNYWSDYAGEDADGDEIGDMPYVIDDNRSDRYPLMETFDIDSVTVELPEWASPPSVYLISPENATYASANVTLEFTIDKVTSWIGYSLDGQEAVVVAGNTTITGLSNGSHNVTVYAKDAVENIGNSETIYFTVEVPEPFPATFVVAAVVILVVFGFGLLINLTRRKKVQEL
jgi:hypothetical protein